VLSGVAHVASGPDWQQSQVNGLLTVRSSSTPSLKSTCPLEFGLLVEIVGVENQRFSPRVEDATIPFLGLALVTKNVILPDPIPRSPIELDGHAIGSCISAASGERVAYLARDDD